MEVDPAPGGAAARAASYIAHRYGSSLCARTHAMNKPRAERPVLSSCENSRRQNSHVLLWLATVTKPSIFNGCLVPVARPAQHLMVARCPEGATTGHGDDVIHAGGRRGTSSLETAAVGGV